MEQKNEIIIYQSQDGTIKVDVLFSEETVWLTQTQIGSLFGKAKSTISEHIKNIFSLSMVRLKINAALPQMGLTSTSLPNKVRKADVEIGKNYLNEEEIEKDS